MGWEIEDLIPGGPSRKRLKKGGRQRAATAGDPSYRVPSSVDVTLELPDERQLPAVGEDMAAIEAHCARRLRTLSAKGLMSERWRYDVRSLRREAEVIVLDIALARPGIFPPGEHYVKAFLENITLFGSVWTVSTVETEVELGSYHPAARLTWDDGYQRVTAISHVTLVPRPPHIGWRGQ